MATGAINFSGINGIDFNSIVDAIMQQESLPLTNMQNAQKATEDRDTALSDLGVQIGKVQTAVKTLAKATSFTDVKAVSSDTTVLSATKGSDALAGHYDVDITELAKAQVTTSTNGYSATSNLAADGGSISFTIDGETTQAITITEETTLAELKDRINDQESGVVASIVNNGSAYKLVITSRATGEDNAFVINNSLTNSDTTAPGFGANTQDARNAEITVNGLEIESASNSIANAIPGLTLNLVKRGSASVDVSANYDDVKDAVKSVVTEYNKLRGLKKGALANDSVMRQVLTDIRSTLTGRNSNSGRYHYLSEVGIEMTSTGDMKFTESAFTTAMADYAADVRKLFVGAAADGVFGKLKTRIEGLDSTAGLIKTTRDAIDLTIERQRERISDQQDRLDLRRRALQRQYSEADQAMSRLSALSSSLTAMTARQF
jgi:flagellar hook-associated protein 2